MMTFFDRRFRDNEVMPMKPWRDWILLRPILRFLAWWGGLFSLIVGTTNCPCCGQPGCPNGLLGAGIFATLFAALAAMFRWLRIAKSEKH
jgi:hypothetical protein